MDEKHRDPRSDENAIPDEPQPAGGLATGLQPGGTIPGGGPGDTVGSIGTPGGQTPEEARSAAERAK